MKYHVGQTSRLLQPLKLISDDPVLAGTPRFQSQNQIIIGIFAPHKLFKLVLLHRIYASVFGSQILRMLVSVLGFFNTNRVVDFPLIIRGNMNRISFSPIALIAF